MGGACVWLGPLGASTLHIVINNKFEFNLSTIPVKPILNSVEKAQHLDPSAGVFWAGYLVLACNLSPS